MLRRMFRDAEVRQSLPFDDCCQPEVFPTEVFVAHFDERRTALGPLRLEALGDFFQYPLAERVQLFITEGFDCSLKAGVVVAEEPLQPIQELRSTKGHGAVLSAGAAS